MLHAVVSWDVIGASSTLHSLCKATEAPNPRLYKALKAGLSRKLKNPGKKINLDSASPYTPVEPINPRLAAAD